MGILATITERAQAVESLSKVYTSEEVQALKTAATILDRHSKEIIADQIRDVVGDLNVTVVPIQSETPEHQTQSNSTIQLLKIKQELLRRKHLESCGTDLLWSPAGTCRIRFDEESIHVGLTFEVMAASPEFDVGEYVYEFNKDGTLSRTYWVNRPYSADNGKLFGEMISCIDEILLM